MRDSDPMNASGAGTPAEAAVDDAALRRAGEYVEREEGAMHRFGGALGAALTALAVVMSLFHLYAAYGIVPTIVLRPAHVGFVLVLTFLLFPMLARHRHRLKWWDVALALASLAITVYILAAGEGLFERTITPSALDQVLGVALMLLVLEAARRTSGWIMPAVVLAFVAYAMVGPWLPAPWTHRGYDVSRLVGHMAMTLEGIFGVAVDVSSSLIILFTIYGAFLQFSSAGRFFIDFSFAAMGSRTAGAGRTVVLASFLLGGPSGSGVATTVTLGSVAWPMLAKAGYERNAAGGLLAAGGLGAILSPPVLGAAAFLIAEFLKISYLDVILMAVIPTLLYYLSILLMVEIDARRYGIDRTASGERRSPGELARRYGFHFISLVAIIAFMLLGFSPVLAVFWATVVAFAASFLARDCALVPHEVFIGRAPVLRGLWGSGLVKALEGGSVGMLNVAATCAAAGIIVGVVTLTGLGLKFSSIVLAYADGGARGLASLWVTLGGADSAALAQNTKLLLTALFTSAIVWIVGLAVPVTASYIICAVIAAPALIQLGVADFAAHMFIFYYAVLSEVSPPTALSPFAAAAITGGDPYRTTLQSWKYTMPAFLLPFMFVLDASGQGLLLMGSFQRLAAADWLAIAQVTLTAAIGIAALAGGMQKWLLAPATSVERWLLIAAGLALTWPSDATDAAGLVLIALVLAKQMLRLRARAAGT